MTLCGDLSDDVSRDISQDKLRLVLQPLALSRELLEEWGWILSYQLRECGNRLSWIWTVLDYEVHIKRGTITNEELPIPIENEPSWRRNIHGSKTIIL